MNRKTRIAIAGSLAAVVSMQTLLAADVRVNINLGIGHPLIQRPVRTVIVSRPMPVVTTRFVYAEPVAWTRVVVAPPPRHRMVWEDTETFHRRDDWVDTYFPVRNTGDALYFRVAGRAQVDFAEVRFRNGEVRVVDFHEAPLEDGTYQLLDFKDGRFVEGVRMVARARAPESIISMLMKK